MITADYHLHSAFSVDCREPMYNVVASAIEKNLTEIVFTDHFETYFPDEPLENVIDYNEYKWHLAELRKHFGEKITILLGSEINLELEKKDEINHIIQKYDFDYIIGSIHNIDFQDVARRSFYEGLSMDEYHEKYFQGMLRAVNAGFNYSTLGHVDLVARYGPYPNNRINIKKQMQYLEPILKKVIEDGKGIELNTSGLRYGVGDVHPSQYIIALYKQLGGEIITVGSDAHFAEHVAENFDFAEAVLKHFGFKYYTVYRKMKPQFIKLS